MEERQYWEDIEDIAQVDGRLGVIYIIEDVKVADAIGIKYCDDE